MIEMRRELNAARGTRPRGLTAIALMLLAELSTGAVAGGVVGALTGGALMPTATLHAQAPASASASAFRLVSAQVVTASGGRPPLLRLAANGPIAFRVLTAEEAAASGVAPGSRRLAVRLYGVRAGDLAASGSLAPFSVVITSASAGEGGSGSDTIVNVGLGGLAPDAALQVRAGQRVNELELVVTP
jgi:hypothetical protein